eukprot:s964_g22.t1
MSKSCAELLHAAGWKMLETLGGARILAVSGRAQSCACGSLLLATERQNGHPETSEEKDMFDDLDDVGLMAQLQGTLKEEDELAAPEDIESAEEALDAEEAKERSCNNASLPLGT